MSSGQPCVVTRGLPHSTELCNPSDKWRDNTSEAIHKTSSSPSLTALTALPAPGDKSLDITQSGRSPRLVCEVNPVNILVWNEIEEQIQTLLGDWTQLTIRALNCLPLVLFSKLKIELKTFQRSKIDVTKIEAFTCPWWIRYTSQLQSAGPLMTERKQQICWRLQNFF